MTGTEEAALRALSDDSDLKRLEDLLGEFNLFDVLQIGHMELQHSWLISWLLNPSGSHGLSDAFLRDFLAQATAAAEERSISVPSPRDGVEWRFTDIEIARERHYIDILVLSEADALACIIENKIFSDEIPGQLRRYLEAVKSTYPGFKPFPIFLTPDGRKPLEQRDQAEYVTFDYGQIADIIDELLARESNVSVSVRSFLEQYTKIIRRFVLDTPSDIDELAMQVYNKHREAIDQIITSKSRTLAVDWTIIDHTIGEYASSLGHDYHSKTYRRFFAYEFENIAELFEVKDGKSWTRSGRMLLFEFKDWDSLWLDLVVGPCKEEVRQRLYKVAHETGQPFRAPPKGGEFSPIYRRPILQKRGEQSDPEVTRLEIDQAIREFFEHDFWSLVNGIRAEFGLEPVSPEGA